MPSSILWLKSNFEIKDDNCLVWNSETQIIEIISRKICAKNFISQSICWCTWTPIQNRNFIIKHQLKYMKGNCRFYSCWTVIILFYFCDECEALISQFTPERLLVCSINIFIRISFEDNLHYNRNRLVNGNETHLLNYLLVI